MKNRKAYYLAYAGQPSPIEYDPGGILSLELFEAIETAEEIISDVLVDELEQYEVRQASGKDLYDLMLGMDIIEYGGEVLALTPAGRYHLERERRSEGVNHTLASFVDLLEIAQEVVIAP